MNTKRILIYGQLIALLFLQSFSYAQNSKSPMEILDQTSMNDTITYNFKNKRFFFDEVIEVKFVDEKMVYLKISGKEIESEEFAKYYNSMISLMREYDEATSSLDFHRNKINDIKIAVEDLKRELKLANLFISNENYDNKKHCSIKYTNDNLYINDIKRDQKLYQKITPLVQKVYDIKMSEPLIIFE